MRSNVGGRRKKWSGVGSGEEMRWREGIEVI